MSWIKEHKWLVFALVTTLTWGVWGEFSELIQQEGFPASMVYIVWAFSMVPCAVAALWIGGWKLDCSWKSLLLGLSAGLLGAGGQLVLFEALRFGPAYIVFPFVSMSPIVTIALSLAFLRERANRVQTFGIVIALAAIFFLSWQDDSDTCLGLRLAGARGAGIHRVGHSGLHHEVRQRLDERREHLLLHGTDGRDAGAAGMDDDRTRSRRG